MEDLREVRRALRFSQIRLACTAGLPRRRLQLSEQGLLKLSAHEQAKVLAELRRAARDLQTYLAGAFGDQVQRRRHRRPQQAGKT